ncbi:hypothetical protein CLU79DRAFT_712535, partial [Phycomyces nitens]
VRQRLKWVERWTMTDMDYLSNCVSVDKSGQNINMRLPLAWSAVDTPAMVTIVFFLLMKPFQHWAPSVLQRVVDIECK